MQGGGERWVSGIRKQAASEGYRGDWELAVFIEFYSFQNKRHIDAEQFICPIRKDGNFGMAKLRAP